MIPTKKEMEQCWDGRFPFKLFQTLQSSMVSIAGLGGLGSHIAVMLARSGVGKLHLVDFDRVEMSNLNRQEYDVRHIGQYKTQALCQRLLEINPYIEIVTDTLRITAENASTLFSKSPIVCEAFDMPDQKAMLINTVLEQCPNTVIVSGNGMAGYGSANTIQTRKFNKRLYICGDEKTDVQSGIGLMAPRVSVCAGHQANQVIRILLNETENELC